MELNENRRKARSLLTYFKRVSGEELKDVDKTNSLNVTNFFAAKNMLLKVNEIPLPLKAKISQDPSAVWENLDIVMDILKDVCETSSQNNDLKDFEDNDTAFEIFLQNTGIFMADNSIQQSQVQGNQNPSENQDFNNKQFLDAMADFFDDTVPEELKNQFSEKQQEAFDFLRELVSMEKIEFIKKHKGFLEDTLKTFSMAILESDFSKMIKLFNDFNNKLNQAQNVEETLGLFAKSMGIRIGIGTNELFQQKGFDSLKKYALLVEKQEEIKELAEMLGRQEADDKETEKKARDAITKIGSKFHPQPSFCGNVVGFTYSGDIGKVLPSEMALLKNPETEMLFYHKFVEKQLLSYKYEIKTKDYISDEIIKKGPIIIAVDTSVSMAGELENIAKIVTFAVTKIALEEKRKCFLISFSSSAEVLDLSDFSGERGLTKLTDFLGCSFYGGTDIDFCMKIALDQVEKNNFYNADILVISDFIAYDFEQSTIKRIKEQKKSGTKLYSLVMGDSQNINILSYFDVQWTYRGSGGEKITFLREMKKKIKSKKT